MTVKDEALKMAIEALETIQFHYKVEHEFESMYKKEIQACKEALEQPTQKPVAWMNDIAFSEYKKELEGDFGKVIPLYTHPKEWQGLSDWEIIDSIDVDCPPDKAICGSTKGIMKLARAIEQKLKEKNT